MATAQQSRILVVEDDAGVRSLIAKHFHRKGYAVEQAAAAEEVFNRMGRIRPRFDVVVTDVHLPGASGVDLARRIKEVNPQQPVVFITGDADALIAEHQAQGDTAGYLLKPFDFGELEAVVTRALAREPHGFVARTDKAAHVTLPAKVVLAPERARHRKGFDARVRVAVATAAILAMAWLAGSALGLI
jgi:DNA-binding NtrC family response regulator